jgi:enoyl-CoA hydratase/carnithine racemase
MIATLRDPAAADTGEIRIDRHGNIAHITLSRPHKRNSLTVTMWGNLETAVTKLGRSDTLDAIVLTGEGGAFSAGADLSEVHAATESRPAAEVYCHAIVRALAAVASSPVPTVALLNGVASGGGAEIALAADIRLGLPGAAMQFPMSRLGVVPDALTLDRLVGAVGPVRAHRLLITAQLVDAQACRQIGLIDELLDETDTEPTLSSLVDELARTRNPGHYRSKELLLGTAGRSVEEYAEEMVASFVAGEVRRRAQQWMNPEHTIGTEGEGT